MTCRRCKRLFSAYLEGDLDTGECHRFEEHLEECRHCATEFSEFRKTVALTNNLPMIQTSPDFDSNLRAKLTEIEDDQGYRVLFGHRAIVFAGIFIFLIGVTLGIYLYRAERGGDQNGDNLVQTLVGRERVPLVRSYVDETVSTKFVMPSVPVVRGSGSEFGDIIRTAAKDWQEDSRNFVLPFVVVEHASQGGSDRHYVIKKINMIEESDEIGL